MVDEPSKEIRVRYITALVVALLGNVSFLVCMHSIVNLRIYFPFLSLEGLWSLIILGLNACLFIFATDRIYNQLKASDVAFEKNSALLHILFDQENLRFSLTM
ncbi:unnamed protein product, partial [Hymenolepis diminuta]